MQFLPLKEMKIDTIILLIGINDFSIRLSQDEQYDPNFLAKPNIIEKLVAETFPGGNQPYPYDSFFKKTALWQMLRKAKSIILQKKVPDKFQDETGKIYVTWREHRRNAAEIRETLPDLSSALDEYAKNINKIIDISQKKSARLILMTQPTMWKPDLPQNMDALLWFGGIGDFQKESSKPYYSVVALEKGIKAYNVISYCRSAERDT